MTTTYYLIQGEDRNINLNMPNPENYFRIAYAADQATAFAWRNKANESEFLFDDVEYVCRHVSRPATKVADIFESVKDHYLLKGDIRNVYYDDIPKTENHSRLVYVSKASTALAWRNKANMAEFTWDEVEFTCKRNKRVTTKTVETVSVVVK